jgi:hypothetical protein
MTTRNDTHDKGSDITTRHMLSRDLGFILTPTPQTECSNTP